MDHLSIAIFKISADLGSDVTSALWGRLLKFMREQLHSRLRSYVIQTNKRVHSCWPSLGNILIFKVLGQVFSVTDYRHAIVSTAILLLGQYLAICPVNTAKELSSGLLICTILLEYTSETKRLVPEVLTFVQSVLFMFSNSNTIQSVDHKIDKLSDSIMNMRYIAASHTTTTENNQHKLNWECFDDTKVFNPTAAVSMLFTCYRVADELFQRFHDSNALPEILLPIYRALQVLKPQQSPELPLQVKCYHIELLEKINKRMNELRLMRKHLMWRPTIKKALPSLAPRYEVNFIPKKDLDPDESKVELKQLNRQLKREKKAAMRELRRDADFLDQEKYKETQENIAKRKENYARNYAWMEEQQATINQHVKAGKGLLKGGGSSVLRKKARVKR